RTMCPGTGPGLCADPGGGLAASSRHALGALAPFGPGGRGPALFGVARHENSRLACGGPAAGRACATRHGRGDRPGPAGNRLLGIVVAPGWDRPPGPPAPSRRPDGPPDQRRTPVRGVDRADIAFLSPFRRAGGRRRSPARRQTGGTARAGRAGLGGRRLKSLASLDQPRLAVPDPGPAVLPALGSRMASYLSLTKPRLVLMVLVTVAVGHLLGARGGAHPATLALTLLGTAMVAGGAGALNQWMERDRDALMRRTANPALPAGRPFGPGAGPLGLLPGLP